MSKGERTREQIIERAASLFNQKGYFGASMSDVMQVTGLQKGGIYNHFGTKDELALLAFDYAAGCVQERVERALSGKKSAVRKLVDMANVWRENMLHPTVAGGCPLLNTAVESDDAHPALRERVRRAMDRWREQIHLTVREGIRGGEFPKRTDAEVVATRCVSTLEGGVMLSKLYRDPVHLERAIAFVQEYVRGLAGQ